MSTPKRKFFSGALAAGSQPGTRGAAGWRCYPPPIRAGGERRTATRGLCKRAAFCRQGQPCCPPAALPCYVALPASGALRAVKSAATRLAARGPDGPLLTARPRCAVLAVKVALRAGCPGQSQHPGWGRASPAIRSVAGTSMLSPSGLGMVTVMYCWAARWRASS